MQMTVCGVQRMAGQSKAGSQFDMCQLLALIPVENSNGKIQVNGAGFRVMELPLDVAALPVFMTQKFPIILDLATEPRPRNGRLETVVTGIVPASAKG